MHSGNLVPYSEGDLIEVGGSCAYRFDRLLGYGGMGFVAKCLDRELNAPVVLKFLKPGWVQAYGARFRREARIIRQIRDPNVVHVETAGVTTDRHALPFYQMDLIPGSPLNRALSRVGGQFELHRGLNIARQLASGVAAIHQRGMIHRDIKPANLLLCVEGSESRLKIIDFGIACLVDEDTRGAFAGTPAYAAPEQILLEQCTPAIDVFAAGVVIYELLTGSHPWPLLTPEMRASSGAVAFELTKFKCRGGIFPPTLVQLLATMLDRDPRKRPDALKVSIELHKVKSALEPISVHEAVTDPGPGDETDDGAEGIDPKEITHVTLGDPTDPDGLGPKRDPLQRELEKRAGILGWSPERMPPGVIALDPTELARRKNPAAGKGNAPDKEEDTDPRGSAFVNDTERRAPAFVNETTPMANRPAQRTAPEGMATLPPSRELPPPASRLPYKKVAKQSYTEPMPNRPPPRVTQAAAKRNISTGSRRALDRRHLTGVVVGTILLAIGVAALVRSTLVAPAPATHAPSSSAASLGKP